ncbi:GCN5-related N-acetyltransferase [Babesia ovata]|uniref:GCN5-related N-acetyltransferase n=1 Tax=Babesia ovata TaxID=189622 RepID=A0A2H6KBF2_9APIC|nr:GCN5-related N-acetyltransferase [Babesia ovata]GBE60314.1 GCN5-related N-acetyltransferase [Babesia ovata]
MDYAVYAVLATGVVITLGIFTKTALWNHYGEFVMTLPHPFLARLGVQRETTGWLVGLCCVLLSLNHAAKGVNALGGCKNAAEALLDLEKFAEDANSSQLRKVFAGALGAMVWVFILHFYHKQRTAHRLVLEHQRKHEDNHITNNCLRFRQAFN